MRAKDTPKRPRASTKTRKHNIAEIERNREETAALVRVIFAYPELFERWGRLSINRMINSLARAAGLTNIYRKDRVGLFLEAVRTLAPVESENFKGEDSSVRGIKLTAEWLLDRRKPTWGQDAAEVKKTIEHAPHADEWPEYIGGEK